MNFTSDSDDSTFLFSTNFSKRKAKSSNDEAKRETSNDDLQRNEMMGSNEETADKAAVSLTTESSSGMLNNNLIQAESDKEISQKYMVADEGPTLKNENDIQQKSKLLHSKITDYYSCPLCLKDFDTEIIQISHMKQCAKKSKMTPKQLLKALEKHKDQLKKRVHSGLSSSSPLKKKKKGGNQDDLESSYELALGLALSKSLSEVNQNHLGSHNFNYKKNITKNNKTTLETFGFTSSNHNFRGTGRRKLKNWKNIQFALRERTKEQRERLITEKAAVILLCKDYEAESYQKPELKGLPDLDHKNMQENEKEQESLWKLGENEHNTNWYVQNIKDFILDEREACVNEENTQKSEECEIVGEIKSLNLPRKSVFQDWIKLVNNRHLSDLKFRSKSSETFYVHSVVLYARCPTMLDLDLQSIFCGFNTVTVLSFLQYLYCGILDGLKRSELEHLSDLARLVNFEELSQVLNILKENLSLNCSERNEITPESSKTLCQKEENISYNLDEDIELENASYDNLLKIYPKVLDSNLNGSLQESVRQNYDSQDAENESSQEPLKNVENKEEEIWEPKKMENVNHMGTQEEINTTLTEIEGENIPSCNNKDHILNGVLWSKYSEKEDSGGDMFEEVDILSPIDKISDGLNIHSPHNEDNKNECILISSESSKDGFYDEERREELNEDNEDFPITDCEIPYFDPYEHFNSEIPLPDSPVLDEEQTIPSQSVFLNEISHAELLSPCLTNSPHVKDNDFLNLETVSPIAISTTRAAEFCSTPITKLDTSKAPSNQNKSNTKYFKMGQRRRSQSLCFKRNRSVITSRLMKNKLLKSSSVKKKSISTNVKNDEEDSGEVANILTESILKELDNSFGITSEISPETNTRKFVELTPAATGERFCQNVSPLPDYSMMNASGIKKHLTKYGLKKSLSKNKAKKILRHIYEELHPLMNMKNGKIIIYEPMEKRNGTKKKSEGKKRKSLKDKKLQMAKRKSVNESGVRKTARKIPDEDSFDNYSPLTRPEAECATSADDGPSSLERSDEYVFEKSDSEVQEPQSQTGFSSGKDVGEAVFDFIYSNPDLHRQILMYEPIWLESFREQLCQKYNKKFKLTDIMDFLDAECITFRCESQRRTNRTIKMRKTKSSNLRNK